MYKIVVFVMLFSYCVARSIGNGRDVLDTPVELPSVATSDTKSIDEVVDENPAQIETESIVMMDAPVNNEDNTRFLFPTTTTTTTTAPVRPFTQTVDLLLVLNSMTMTARK